MVARLRRVAADVLQGRNLDAYSAVVIASVVGVLGMLGITGLRWIGPVLLLCLVPLITLILGLRHEVQQQTLAGSGLVPAFPADMLEEDWRRDTDVLLVGITLITTVRKNQEHIRRRLRQGKQVRVLIVEPTDTTAMFLTDDRQPGGAGDAASNAREAGLTLVDLTRIAAAVPASTLEVRTIRFPIGHGGYGFSLERSEARLYVETYPFRTTTAPHFVLTRTHGAWFEHFSAELENMWAAGKPVVLPPVAG